MKKKIRVGILCGGKSAEHEISLISAKNVISAIDRNKYEVVVIGIDKEGTWRFYPDDNFILNPEDPKAIRLIPHGSIIALIPGKGKRQFLNISSLQFLKSVDVVFPVLHGPFGEDGTVQGLLKLIDIPFVGASVLGSAVGMDKEVTKRLLQEAKIPVPKFLVLHKNNADQINFDLIKKKIRLPLFIKPSNLGSSVGIHKVKTRNDFRSALKDAFQYDRKILIEEFIEGREIECSVLGNEHPIASLPGEIVPRHEFYSYEAKYLDKDGALLKAPAALSPRIVKKVQELAIKTFKTLNCEGMARVDFFLRNEQELFVNELNTIPGFTKISMYPKLWEISGIPYRELIDRLIQLALER
ncbi:MAG: D-alanine--D-alanine ligase, partial [candidate division WOR-3 bacterium]